MDMVLCFIVGVLVMLASASLVPAIVAAMFAGRFSPMLGSAAIGAAFQFAVWYVAGWHGFLALHAGAVVTHLVVARRVHERTWRLLFGGA